MSSFQFLQPQLPKIKTQTQRFVDTPVSHKTVSLRKQRKQMRHTLRGNDRQISGELNKNLKKKSTQQIENISKYDIINEIPPQFIPSNESWHQKMNSISPLD